MRTITWAVGFAIPIGSDLAQPVDPPRTAEAGDYYSEINPDHVGPDLSRVGADMTSVRAR